MRAHALLSDVAVYAGAGVAGQRLPRQLHGSKRGRVVGRRLRASSDHSIGLGCWCAVM